MSKLIIKNLEAGYGHVKVLHKLSLEISNEPIAIMGRNGMGKSTLAQTIMGLIPISGGSIEYDNKTLNGMAPYQIARHGIAYVPQGRRIFPSLSVDEHLKMVEKRGGAWTTKKIYELFPRLGERKKNGGAMLSGGEQQMLAIGRALLTNPSLLLMDEPSEGLAPAVVEHLAETLRTLVREGQQILLIEQHLGFATSLCDNVLILSNGEIQTQLSSSELKASHELQNKYLGVA
jgi:branched-chain amino acid transport system ATP-binding protein